MTGRMVEEESLEAKVRTLAAASLTRLPALTDQVVDAVWSSVYRLDGPVPKDDLRRSCQDNLAAMLGVLAGRGLGAADVYRTARATGMRRAMQRCPLEWVLHAWRVAGQVIWDDFTRRAGPADVTALRSLVHAAKAVWGVSERFAAVMAAAYGETERDLLTGAGPDERRLVDALVDGRAHEVDALAARAFGFTPAGRYLVAVIERPAPGPGPPYRVRRALRRAGVSSVWRWRVDGQVGIIAADDPHAIAAVLRSHIAGRVGVSPQVKGFTGIPAGHRMAVRALAGLREGSSGVAVLDEYLPEALLASTPELAERLIQVAVGPLLAVSERNELLNTLAVWLASTGSAVRTAQRLHCHRNTVLNRLRRIESLAGLDLTQPRNCLLMELALLELSRSGQLSCPLLETTAAPRAAVPVRDPNTGPP